MAIELIFSYYKLLVFRYDAGALNKQNNICNFNATNALT